MAKTIPDHDIGSGNIFADIGLPDAETHLLKAQMVSRIQDILDGRHLSQAAAAALMGIRQPDLSRILHGQFRGFSVERLMTMLTALGCEIDIVVRAPGQPVRAADTIHLHPPGP